MSGKIRAVRALEEQGGGVLVGRGQTSADARRMGCSDRPRKTTVRRHRRRYSCGRFAGGGIIALKTPEAAAAVLASKIKGTLVLHSLVKDLDLKFFLLCSSINSIVSAPAQVDYCAANAFQDAFAHQRIPRRQT